MVATPHHTTSHRPTPNTPENALYEIFTRIIHEMRKSTDLQANTNSQNIFGNNKKSQMRMKKKIK